MNRFNLTFRGEIIAGHDPEQVRTSLARELAIDDPARLQDYFSGDPVVLRRNMERKEAAELYARLQQMGIQVELVKIPDRGSLQSDAKLKTPAGAGPGRTEAPPDSSHSVSEALRKADLAAQQSLPEEDKAELAAREKALKRALKAKQKETGRRKKAAPPGKATSPRMSAAQAAKLKAQLQQQAKAAARRQAELELSRTRELNRQAVAQAEHERLEAERRQRLEVERAEQARREAEERLRLEVARAERERAQRERIEAERAEQARLEAQEQARREAARQEKARIETERAEQARREAAERERLAAEKAAQREQEKRRAEQLAARVQVENARRKREQAAEAARRKLEEARNKARLQAELEEQAAQRREMEEQAIQRAAVELAHKPGLKPMDARIRTRLETPSRQRQSAETAPGGKRKRQAGAPNLYHLRPFRNTPEIRARAGQSHRIMRLGFTGAAIALAAGLAMGIRLLSLPPPATVTGATAVAIPPQEGPLLLAGEHLLLHDRAGVSGADIVLDDLGLSSLQAPLAFDASGRLLAPGQLSGETGTPHLLRCTLAQRHCEPVSPVLADTAVSALAVHPIDGSLFIADARAGELLRLGAEGAVLARAPADIPPAPVLRLDSGLLMMNSALGPAISVYRYEDEAFGQQLDEILLLPPGSDGSTPVRDFIWSGEHWWVLLAQDTGGLGLYRFDSQWQLVDQPRLPGGSRPTGLVNWGTRTLVEDPSQLAVQRFNSAGETEAALISGALTGLAESQAHRSSLVLLGWRIGLALCLLAAIAGLCLGALHQVRSLVYKSCRERGAEPIDKLADSIEWIDAAPERAASLGRTGIAYTVLAMGLVLGAIGLGVSSLQLSALLVTLAGPAAALLLLQRSEPEHIGILGAQLLLVDHEGMYQLGGGSRIHYRGPFLMIDDVAVFTGTRLLPAFSPAAIATRVVPVAAEGIRVDRKIVTVKLLQSRHPLALGAVAIAIAIAAAAALLSLQGIF